MAENVLVMRGICKSFGGVPVLKNVDFTLQKGMIHALVGGNGAGKSTLMKIMSGVYSCDSGSITVNSVTKHITSPNVAREMGIKMIFQELSLVPTLTVAENIFLNHEKTKRGFMDSAAMQREAKELLHRIGVDIDVKKTVSDLDVGVCQLIEIAKAISTSFSVLIMDEPTASLTEEETQNLFSIMRKLKQEGVSIVYISHRLKEVLKIADEISVLRDGNIVRHDTADHFRMEDLIEDIIGKGSNARFQYISRDEEISSELMLRVEDLGWHGNPNRISFDVKKGEVVGLVGLLGSGRTEIVETLFGIRKQSGCRIYVDGQLVQSRNVSEAIANGFALIPEDRRRQGLTLIHSLESNVSLPNLKKLCGRLFLRPRNVKRYASEAIEEFGVKANGPSDPISSLSGGNQQKIVIAKWFKKEPKILLMDEPDRRCGHRRKNGDHPDHPQLCQGEEKRSFHFFGAVGGFGDLRPHHRPEKRTDPEDHYAKRNSLGGGASACSSNVKPVYATYGDGSTSPSTWYTSSFCARSACLPSGRATPSSH